MPNIDHIDIRCLRLPLTLPYVLSYRTFNEFEPYIAVISTDDGRTGFGEGHISPGSSSETREGGWRFITDVAESLLGLPLHQAVALVAERIQESPVAATALMTALEMLTSADELHHNEDVVLPLLAPVSGATREALETELEAKLADGFCTFKVKVGKDVAQDLERLAIIQSVVAGRASLRIDANRAYSKQAGIEFSTRLDPTDVMLFEQPCAAEDWQANAEVAAVSRVPLMLDEPICGEDDIKRAADIEGVGYLKVKLKRFGGLQRLKAALETIRAEGMQPVLGDGLGAEIACWMEACLAKTYLYDAGEDNAGEFNGYLKPSLRLFTQPLGFNQGALVIPAGYRPALNDEIVQAHTQKRFVLGSGL